jgi:colanic acid/amylovoran biosynthesis glycosyltransferase
VRRNPRGGLHYLRKLWWPHHSEVLGRVARRHGARILHSHWGDTAWGDLDDAGRFDLRHVVTFYGKDVNYLPQSHPVWKDRYREMFARVDLILCEGPHMAGRVAALGCPEERVAVHHLGVPLAHIPFMPRSWKGGTLRALLAGSFREKKGFPDALRALGRLLKDGVDVEVTVIGDASADRRSHPEKERILEALRDCDLVRRTRLLGYQPHEVFFREASAHHIFISPSRTAPDGDTEGGAPVTLVEMAASGMPIVSTRHCDIPMVVLDGRTGWLADEGDVAGLHRHLRWWVEHPSEWIAMLEAGRRHIEAEFDASTQGARLAAIYERLAG